MINIQDLSLEFKKWTDGPKYLLIERNHWPKGLEIFPDFAGTKPYILNMVSRLSRVSTVYVVGSDDLVYTIQNNRPEISVKSVK